MESQNNSPEMDGDASIMSEQIVEKLKLLDYETLFTKIKYKWNNII